MHTTGRKAPGKALLTHALTLIWTRERDQGAFTVMIIQVQYCMRASRGLRCRTKGKSVEFFRAFFKKKWGSILESESFFKLTPLFHKNVVMVSSATCFLQFLPI